MDSRRLLVMQRKGKVSSMIKGKSSQSKQPEDGPDVSYQQRFQTIANMFKNLKKKMIMLRE